MIKKVVFFDLGGVLFKFTGGLEKLAIKNNLKYQDFVKVFKKHDDEVCRGEITPQQLWDIYKKELNLQQSIPDFAEYWVGNFILIKETKKLIKSLSKNYQIGIISNIYKGIFTKLIEKDFFPENLNFNPLILSCNVGFVKPEIEIYKFAENKCKVCPENIYFIDDKEEFLIPAKKRGWNTIKFETNNAPKSINIIYNILS